MRTGVTPSGIRPGLEVSKTAILPPGPVSGRAMRSGLAEALNFRGMLLLGFNKVPKCYSNGMIKLLKRHLEGTLTGPQVYMDSNLKVPSMIVT
jgi:hypothetical protein